VSDFTIRIEVSQQFVDGNIHPCACASRKLSPAEFNYDIFDKAILAIVYALRKWNRYILSTQHTTMIFLNDQNLEYFTKKVKLTR
jgi:hypothetical protein